MTKTKCIPDIDSFYPDMSPPPNPSWLWIMNNIVTETYRLWKRSRGLSTGFDLNKVSLSVIHIHNMGNKVFLFIFYNEFLNSWRVLLMRKTLFVRPYILYFHPHLCLLQLVGVTIVTIVSEYQWLTSHYYHHFSLLHSLLHCFHSVHTHNTLSYIQWYWHSAHQGLTESRFTSTQLVTKLLTCGNMSLALETIIINNKTAFNFIIQRQRCQCSRDLMILNGWSNNIKIFLIEQNSEFYTFCAV